eukprot:gene27548-49172_t
MHRYPGPGMNEPDVDDAPEPVTEPASDSAASGGQNSLANTPRIRQSAYIVQRAHKPA